MRHARVLLCTGAIAGLIKFLQAEGLQTAVQKSLLKLKSDIWHLPENLDFIINFISQKLFNAAPKIGGYSFKDLSISSSLELSLIGAGGMMGIRAGFSLLVGAILNFAILAPIMIQHEQIKPIIKEGVATYGQKAITVWSLWPGVACLVIAAFAAFFASPKLLIDPIIGLFKKRETSDVLKDVELPLWVSIAGVPIVGLVAAWMAHSYFGVDMLMCVLGLPVAFILSVIAANSTALTSITPISATAKITQLYYGVLQPKNITTNITTAGLTAEVVSNASNLLMDLKPGYMLGAKPRLQAISHVIGIVSGAVFSVPLFYVLFAQNIEKDGMQSIQSDAFPMPSVTVWRAVAEVLTQGVSALPSSVVYAIVAGVLIGLALEVARVITRGKFWLHPVPLGWRSSSTLVPALPCFSARFCFGVLVSAVVHQKPHSQTGRRIGGLNTMIRFAPGSSPVLRWSVSPMRWSPPV